MRFSPSPLGISVLGLQASRSGSRSGTVAAGIAAAVLLFLVTFALGGANYFSDAFGTPWAAVIIAGLVVITLSAVATGWPWFRREHPPTGRTGRRPHSESR